MSGIAGEMHHNAKTNEADVVLMRKLFAERRRLMDEADKLTIEKIAEKFNVSFTLCRDAIFRQTWKHVLDDSEYEVS